jgi:hypothetical protein
VLVAKAMVPRIKFSSREAMMRIRRTRSLLMEAMCGDPPYGLPRRSWRLPTHNVKQLAAGFFGFCDAHMSPLGWLSGDH